ncbi:MAG: DUF2203 domain-containing protein [Acidobacteria bacterium]|nr:DUF2203 domain-containing protein [Acidobacteriota bacterium]MCA1607902.1 DUF2203 domain-containing protein [Acidobacteriota bacterium]
MKLFTIEQANELLPRVRKILETVRRLYEISDKFREAAGAAAAASQFGGGMEGGSYYVETLYKIGKHTTELHELGVQLKDHRRGLVDFPYMRSDRIVLLCWQLGEPEQIEWWHEVETGFAGRKPV